MAAKSSLAGPCQRKVEMSYSLQSRNVRFSPGGVRVRGSLGVPVKRRRAMLASNPIKEYPAGTHLRTMRWSVILPARSATWARGRPAGGGSAPPQGLVFDFGLETTSDQIDSDMP